METYIAATDYQAMNQPLRPGCDTAPGVNQHRTSERATRRASRRRANRTIRRASYERSTERSAEGDERDEQAIRKEGEGYARSWNRSRVVCRGSTLRNKTRVGKGFIVRDSQDARAIRLHPRLSGDHSHLRLWHPTMVMNSGLCRRKRRTTLT